MAREVHAITAAPLAPAPWDADAEATGAGSVGDFASVTVEVPELCPRFTARAFTDVRVGPSPLWLRARLRGAGQRSISNAVDVTNYVMLMTAQPLHAFDLDRVPGGELIVRTAREGEKMTTLDGVERVFDAETVLVCDRNGPSGIAGIMGGQVSEVSGETTRILLEVATWNGVNILRTSSMLGLRTDASTRFEKQLHPELAMRAQRVASCLYVELCGASLVPGDDRRVGGDPPGARHLAPRRQARFAAGNPRRARRGSRASGGAGVRGRARGRGRAGGDRAGPPPLRRHPRGRRGRGGRPPPRPRPAAADAAGARRSLRRALARAGASPPRRGRPRGPGLDEIVAWHFVPGDLPRRLGIEPSMVSTGNPISAEHSGMRTTLLGGLLDAARHNLARDAERVALFESGRVFLPEPSPAEGLVSAGVFAGRIPPPVHEVHRIGALAVGSLAPASWRGAGEPAGFYELKGVLERISAGLGVEPTLVPPGKPFLHSGPGRADRDRRPRRGLDRRAASARRLRVGSARWRRVRDRHRDPDRGL